MFYLSSFSSFHHVLLKRAYISVDTSDEDLLLTSASSHVILQSTDLICLVGQLILKILDLFVLLVKARLFIQNMFICCYLFAQLEVCFL